MEAVAQEIAERLRPAPFVRIVTHIDTDGITGGAIASEALDRAGISHEVAFVKKLDDAVITDLKRQGTPLVWFIDLGAGMLHALHGLDAVITDHHVPTEREVPKALRGDLVRFTESQDRVLMLNPHLEGEGSDVASGAGCAYAVAKALSPKNTDLAAIAVVGAVGDVQDQEFRRLSGYNRTILADGIAAGVLEAGIDLRLLRREKQPDAGRERIRDPDERVRTIRPTGCRVPRVPRRSGRVPRAGAATAPRPPRIPDGLDGGDRGGRHHADGSGPVLPCGGSHSRHRGRDRREHGPQSGGREQGSADHRVRPSRRRHQGLGADDAGARGPRTRPRRGHAGRKPGRGRPSRGAPRRCRRDDSAGHGGEVPGRWEPGGPGTIGTRRITFLRSGRRGSRPRSGLIHSLSPGRAERNGHRLAGFHRPTFARMSSWYLEISSRGVSFTSTKASSVHAGCCPIWFRSPRNTNSRSQ